MLCQFYSQHFFHISVKYSVQAFSERKKFLSDATQRNFHAVSLCVLATQHEFLLLNKWTFPEKHLTQCLHCRLSVAGLKWRCWGCTTRRSIGSYSNICWDIQHWQRDAIRMESEPQKGAFSLALVALLLTLTTAQQRMYTTHLHLFQVPTKAHIYVDTRGTSNPRSIYINLVVVPIINLMSHFDAIRRARTTSGKRT